MATPPPFLGLTRASCDASRRPIAAGAPAAAPSGRDPLPPSAIAAVAFGGKATEPFSSRGCSTACGHCYHAHAAREEEGGPFAPPPPDGPLATPPTKPRHVHTVGEGGALQRSSILADAASGIARWHQPHEVYVFNFLPPAHLAGGMRQPASAPRPPHGS